MPRPDNIGVGVALILPHPSEKSVLMSPRLNHPGGTPWQMIGGWLEPGELPLTAVAREAKEEADITLYHAEPVDEVWCWSAHYQNIWVCTKFFLANYWSGTPKRTEPDKAGEWEWVSVEGLEKRNLFYRQYLSVLDNIRDRW